MENTNKKESLKDLLKRKPVFTATLLAIIVLTFGTMFFNNSGSSKNISHVNQGEEGYLSMSGSDTIFLFKTKDDLDLFHQSVSQGDQEVFQEMILTGRSFGVPNGTRVRVIDNTFSTREIRVLEGSYLNKTGWVDVEFIKK